MSFVESISLLLYNEYIRGRRLLWITAFTGETYYLLKDGEEFSRYIIIGRRFRKQNSCMCYYLSHDFIIRLERLLYVKIVLKK